MHKLFKQKIIILALGFFLILSISLNVSFMDQSENLISKTSREPTIASFDVIESETDYLFKFYNPDFSFEVPNKYRINTQTGGIDEKGNVYNSVSISDSISNNGIVSISLKQTYNRSISDIADMTFSRSYLSKDLQEVSTNNFEGFKFSFSDSSAPEHTIFSYIITKWPEYYLEIIFWNSTKITPDAFLETLE